MLAAMLTRALVHGATPHWDSFDPLVRADAPGALPPGPREYIYQEEDQILPELTRDTPFGAITLVEEAGAIVALNWGGEGVDETPVLIEAHRQLAAYFAGELTEFNVPLAPKVSPRQREFLDALIAIPFGETLTYGEIAKTTGLSAQAAGQACGANPIAIIIPCHRVTGTGNLGGFSAPGGVETKVALLKHEGAASLLI